MTTTQMVPRNIQIQSVRSLLEKSKEQIGLALPRHMSPDRMLRVVMTSIQRTPKLLECTPQSLLGAVMQAAQLGLEPDGALGHAYLVPYKSTVTLIPGYRGLIDLARRSGHVESIQARIVYDKDEFDFAYGDTPFLTHKPCRDDDPGDMLAVYCVARLKGGEKPFEVMWKRQVDAIRKRSMASSAGPWVTDYEEMARKTAVRRLCKYLPLSVELATAVALDERAEAGLPQNMDVLEIDGPEAPAEVPAGSSLDKLADGMAGEAEADPAPSKRAGTIAEIVQAADILGPKKFGEILKAQDARVSDLHTYDEERLDKLWAALSAAAGQ